MLLLPRLNQALRFSQAVGVCVLSAFLVAESGFALRCHLQQHAMKSLVTKSMHRQAACLELGWRWEADDQENQYKPGTSAGSRITVGPISGFVMDVFEDENGHAEGQCHAINASYSDLMPRY
jgi:hypothetical protein